MEVSSGVDGTLGKHISQMKMLEVYWEGVVVGEISVKGCYWSTRE